ncbi:CSLREA domain-containing protein [Acinetobacter bohemicus]|uniref:CSLREA domain-containing protein n=1 Tax=Acinetobacter bohemicus TaxID=1435036 RepID=UPI004042692E
MKNYKKGFLCSMVLAAMSLMAAEDKIIYVNTFVDENGDNLNNCSLREAIQTAKKNTSHGGCSAGNTSNGQKDIIQLEAGEYILKSELTPESDVFIYGKSPADPSTKNALTHNYPALKELKTSINANNTSRIFNTSDTNANINLTNLILKNGYSEKFGGALFVGASLNMVNSAILNSESTQEGGAIYFVAHNEGKKINLSQVLIQGNKAKQGSVLAMDCRANLLDTKAVINISNSSIVKNRSANSLSMIELCGKLDLNLTASTIAKNQVDSTKGSIIRAVGDNHFLSSNYSFTAKSNTIVENDAYSTFYYDDNGAINLSFNLLAFNKGKSCRYALNNGDLTDTKRIINASQNAFSSEGVCDLPTASNAGTNDSNTNLNLGAMNILTVLSPYQEASEYNLFLPLYYPKNNQNEFDLVNVKQGECSKTDQRGIQRVTNGTLLLNPTMKNICDIGSVELMRLTAADITDLFNDSYTQRIADYKKLIDKIKVNIKDPNHKDYLIQNTEDLKIVEDLLKYTTENQQYRAIYVDPFALALPNDEEVPNSNGAMQPKALNFGNYNIITQERGELIEKNGVGEFVGDPDPNFKCVWNSDLKRIMLYRTDGKLADLTGPSYCSYTIQSNQVAGLESTGVLKAQFKNIAPIAKSDEYSITPSSNSTLSINPLENDSDDGDGPTTKLNASYKGAFYKNAAGVELPIRIDKIPEGLIVTADHTGPCPGNDIRFTCYGGQLHIQVKNNFSQFNDQLTYSIYDAEGSKSDEAVIFLKNTAQNSSSTASGGGSIGVWSILGLMGLGLYRARRKKQ